MSSSPFSKRSALMLFTSAIALAALSVLLHAYDNSPRASGSRSNPGSYSVSAIGHAGCFDMLRRLGLPVRRSVGNALAMTGARGTLIIAEPNFYRLNEDAGGKLLTAPRLLLVLPKWRGKQDTAKPAWISDMSSLPLSVVTGTLHNVTSGRSQVVRVPWPTQWAFNRFPFSPRVVEGTQPLPPPGLEAPKGMDSMAMRDIVPNLQDLPALSAGRSATGDPTPSRRPRRGAVPDGDNRMQLLTSKDIDVVQLIKSNELRPIVGTADGMLVGEMTRNGKTIWILADPDIMANHGIVRGGNAAFMACLVDALRFTDNTDPTAPVVFDETVHGFMEAEGSPLKLLFRFPFVVVTALLCLTGVLAACAGAGRFGAAATPERPLDFGKAGLIANGARLFDYAGHHSSVLQYYIRMCLRTAGQALHAPAHLEGAALAAWLDRIGEARGLRHNVSELFAASESLRGASPHKLSRLLSLAREMHQWKGELLNGSQSHRHHH